jgi:hypothetical protein
MHTVSSELSLGSAVAEQMASVRSMVWTMVPVALRTMAALPVEEIEGMDRRDGLYNDGAGEEGKVGGGGGGRLPVRVAELVGRGGGGSVGRGEGGDR